MHAALVAPLTSCLNHRANVREIDIGATGVGAGPPSGAAAPGRDPLRAPEIAFEISGMEIAPGQIRILHRREMR